MNCWRATSLAGCVFLLNIHGCTRAVPLDVQRQGAVASAVQPTDERVDSTANDAAISLIESPIDASTRRCEPWAQLSHGVTVRRCSRGEGTVILMAGWRVTMTSTQRWADALDTAALQSLGARTLYAVEGPLHVDFRAKELGVNELLRDAGAPARWTLVVAHSSGAHVAATLFDRAFRQHQGALHAPVVYVDLDGDRGIVGDPERLLTAQSTHGIAHILFVGTENLSRHLQGFSMSAMVDGQRSLLGISELMTYDASASGCMSNPCAHLALINSRPYPRGNESYSRFEQGPVNTAWLTRVMPWLTR